MIHHVQLQDLVVLEVQLKVDYNVPQCYYNVEGQIHSGVCEGDTLATVPLITLRGCSY